MGVSESGMYGSTYRTAQTGAALFGTGVTGDLALRSHGSSTIQTRYV